MEGEAKRPRIFRKHLVRSSIGRKGRCIEVSAFSSEFSPLEIDSQRYSKMLEKVSENYPTFLTRALPSEYDPLRPCLYCYLNYLYIKLPKSER